MTFERICYQCGEDCSVDKTVCSSCHAKMVEHMVPPLFWGTETHRLIGLSPAIVKALEWTPASGRGLVIVGASGAGKTRAMWEVLKRNMDRSTVVFSPGPQSFSNQLSMHYKHETSHEFLNRVSTAPLLAIDDVTKLKMTDRVESELFGIADYRCCYNLPTIITVQAGGGIMASMSEDRGLPLVRRLREFSDVVQL